MLCIAHSNTDPYFNLAAEEYLLTNFSDDFFMLWRNDKSIVVGKHQNTLAEINMDYVKEKKIKVARRISGGGAVYHDLGNLNFTFIMTGHEGNLVDFKKYINPILEVLQKLSVDARFQGKNNLTVNGKKISGNAEHVYKKKVLHHGTLLFSSVMEDLNFALEGHPLKYKSKAVKSIRSSVTNIREHLNIDLDVIKFRDMIMDHIMETHPDTLMYEFSGEDINNIKKLKKDKYNTWEWNFGYSPKYDFEKSFNIRSGNIQVHLSVYNGIIQKVKIHGDYLKNPDNTDIEVLFTGIQHNETILLEKLKSIPFPDYFKNISPEEFVKGLF